jgi:hypothetical protein
MTVNSGPKSLLSQTEWFDGLCNELKACAAAFRKMCLLEQVGAIRRNLDRMFCDRCRLDEIAGRALDA